jgi:hypothetical protein
MSDSLMSPGGVALPFPFRCIGQLLGANFNITTDQVIPITTSGRTSIEFLIFLWKSGTPGPAVGGVYGGAGKTGRIYVPAATAYTGLTGAGTALQIVPAAFAIDNGPLSLFLSLTTPAGAAATCDVFAQGSTYDN